MAVGQFRRFAMKKINRINSRKLNIGSVQLDAEYTDRYLESASIHVIKLLDDDFCDQTRGGSSLRNSMLISPYI